MRGALFESWVVSEMVKHSFNQGQPAELFFWRDHVGNEIDVVFDTPAGLQGIEIKSGRTFAPDWPTPALKWQSLPGNDALPPAIIYGGEGRYERQGCRVLGWRELASS
jgi:hypothetical protein